MPKTETRPRVIARLTEEALVRFECLDMSALPPEVGDLIRQIADRARQLAPIAREHADQCTVPYVTVQPITTGRDCIYQDGQGDDGQTVRECQELAAGAFIVWSGRPHTNVVQRLVCSQHLPVGVRYANRDRHDTDRY